MPSGVALAVGGARGGAGGGGGGGAEFDEYLCLCFGPGEFAGDGNGQASAGWDGEGGGVFEWGSS